MLKEIKINANLTSFKDDISFELSKELNFVFGYNGYGKSSLSRLINNYSNYPLFSFDESRLTSFTSKNKYDVAFLNIDKQNISKVNALVFNKDFVDSVIHTNDFRKHKFKPTADLKENLNNPLKNEYYKALNDFDVTKEKFNQKENAFISAIEKDLENGKKRVNGTSLRKINIETVLNNWQNPIDKTLEQIEELGNIMLRKYTSVNIFTEGFKINEISFNEQQFINFLNDINEKLNFTEKLSIDSFMSKIDIKKKQWIIEGINYVKESELCPFCNKPTMKNNDRIDEYYRYVNSLVNQYSIKLSKDFAMISRIKDEKITEINKSLQLAKDNISFFNSEKLGAVKDNILILISVLDEVSSIIKKKLNNMYESLHFNIQIEKFDILKDSIDQFNSEIVKFNTDVQSYLKQKSKLKNEYLENYVVPKIYLTKSDEYDELTKDRISLSQKELDMNIKKEKYLVDLKSKEPVAKVMNQKLISMNFTKYEVDHSFNLVYNHNILVSSKVETSLSEGEKTIIALALFLAKIELEFNYLEDIDLLVIDDPISSLDYEKIYTISNIVSTLYNDYKNKNIQFIILTHNHIFSNLFTYNKPYNYIKIEKDDLNKAYFIYGHKALTSSLYMSKLEIIKKVSKLNSTELDFNNKMSLHNHCRYVLESISKFMYPNNDGLNVLEDEIKKIKKENGDYIFSRSKVESLFRLINKGSHASIEYIHDLEDYHDNDYITAAKTTIRIIEHYFPKQLIQ